MLKLSIIIPCYNAEPYIFELLECLEKQIHNQPDVEVIIIDDGSKKPLKLPSEYTWCSLSRFSENQGASAARNAGLNIAKGQYIAFIDADDLVADNYIETILNKAKTEKFDYCYLSWKAFGGWPMNVVLNSVDDQFPEFNLCVWNRIYKRSMIGKVRFNTKKAVAEDAQFIREVKEDGKKKAFIHDYMYFYRSDANDSLTKRASSGKLAIKRILYYFRHVTADMSYLIEEFKEADKDSEVILMTDQNDIPELENYAVVISPRHMKATELRGEKTAYYHEIPTPLKTQVLIFVAAEHAIGGIEQFTYYFCKQMHKYYDIMVLYHKGMMDQGQLARLLPYADVVNNDPNKPIICDTAINCRVVLPLPENVQYKKKIQLVHTCRLKEQWQPVEDADDVYYVSHTSAKSFEDPEGKVIYNLTCPENTQEALLLVSATRLTYEKGAERMRQLADMLNAKGIPFTWIIFTDAPFNNPPDNVVFMRPRLNIKPWIKSASYLVQLSDCEAFGFSMVEALELGTPIITTKLPVLPEIGFVEGVNGYSLPFNVTECQDIEKIYNHQCKGFEYTHNNADIVSQWRKILGNTKPTIKRKLEKGFRYVLVLKNYDDGELHRSVKAGEVLKVKQKRAEEGAKLGLYRILEA